MVAGSATLGLGMVFSQGLALATMPILTRLYDTRDFGVLAVYSSLVGVLGTAASLRYEFAIPLPRRGAAAVRLVQLAVVLTMAFGFLMTLGLLSISSRVIQLLHAQATPYVLLLVPLGIVALSIYQTLNFWALRERNYPAVARTRVTQGVGRVIVQLGGSALFPGAYPLVLGDIIGQSAGSLRLWALFTKRQRRLLFHWSGRRLWNEALRFREFPLFSLPSNLIAIGVHQVMPLVLGLTFGASAAGLFGLAYRVVQVPINLLNATVSQAYYAEGMRINAESREGLRPLFRATLFRLAALGAIPALLLITCAPIAFSTVFGSEWYEAGRLAAILVPCMYLQALVSPLSQTLLIIERQRLNLVLDVCRVIVLSATLGLGALFGVGVQGCVAIFSATMCVLYLTNLFIYYHALSDQRAAREMAAPKPITN